MKTLFLIICLFFCGFYLAAGSPDDVIVAGYIETSPRIDGEIDPVYESFRKVDKFYQLETGWGEPSSEGTVAYFGYDEKNLYFAVKCYDSDPNGIRAHITQREDMSNSDLVFLFLDTFKTRRRALFFGFNPLGIQMEGTRDDENRHDDMDFSWDALWFSQGKVYDWGYFVEGKIPFKSIRFPANGGKQEWGVIVGRAITRKGEFNTSVKIDQKIRGFLTQASTLVIDRKIESGKNLEAIPTVVGVKSSDHRLEPEFGLSVKYGITSNSTVDLTYNPDFSHIESDQGMIDVNQRFALYYPEKRPFFLEAKEIFDMPLNLFYSRRIADPDWGMKFTGRFGNSGVGFISARDRGSFENLDDISEGGEDTAFVNVLRYKYQVKESSHVGVFAANKNWNGKNAQVFAADTFLKVANFAFSLQAAYTGQEDQKGGALHSALTFSGKNLDYGGGYARYAPNFDPQTGFQKRNGYWTYWVHGGYSFFPEKPYLLKITPGFLFTENFDWQTGELLDRQFSLRLNALSFRNSSFHFRVQKSFEKYEGLDFDKLDFSLGYHIDLTKALGLGGNFRFGDSINYGEEIPYLGYSYALSLWSNVNIFKRIGLAFDYSNYYFYDRPGGNLELKMNIYRLRNTVLYTREISSRLIYEFNDYYQRHYLSLLLGYELNPGTVFYLGMASDFGKYHEDRPDDFSVFFKFSYFLRM